MKPENRKQKTKNKKQAHVYYIIMYLHYNIIYNIDKQSN